MKQVQSLLSNIRLMQLQLNPGLQLSPDQVQVQLYRDRADMAILDRLDRCFQQQSPLPAHLPDSFAAFVLSKPNLQDGVIRAHALVCLGQDGQPNGELWLKLKSAAALATAFDGSPPLHNVSPQQQLQGLQAQLLGEHPLFPVKPRQVQQGPEWLRTPIELHAESGAWQLPILETPLDVPERFAGHYYLKLLSTDHPAGRSCTPPSKELIQ